MQTRDVAPVIPPGAFYNRLEEWELYQPLNGSSMLEFGGKINAPYTYKSTFEALGFRHISVDWNGDHGAMPLDLRHPISLGQFDMVTNIGTSEHVESQDGVWRNMVDACRVGSVLLSTTPLPGGDDWWWHGEWYPTKAFYEQLADLNHFHVERITIEQPQPRRMFFVRLVRMKVAAFVMPDLSLITRNEIRPR